MGQTVINPAERLTVLQRLEQLICRCAEVSEWSPPLDLNEKWLDLEKRLGEFGDVYLYTQVQTKLEAVAGEPLHHWDNESDLFVTLRLRGRRNLQPRPLRVGDLIDWLIERVPPVVAKPPAEPEAEREPSAIYRRISEIANALRGADREIDVSESIESIVPANQLDRFWTLVEFRENLDLPSIQRHTSLVCFWGALSSLIWIGGCVPIEFSTASKIALVHAAAFVTYWLLWRRRRPSKLPEDLQTFGQLADHIAQRREVTQ